MTYHKSEFNKKSQQFRKQFPFPVRKSGDFGYNYVVGKLPK